MHIFVERNKKEELFLRKKVPAIDLAKETKNFLRDLARTMRKVMKSANGVGLSANQIGVSKRLFVAEVPDEQGRLKFYAFVNPEIKKVAGDRAFLEEGCLSVP